MIFFFKKKKITIDCFTSNKAAYEVFKVDHAKKFFPEWWKQLPNAIRRDEKYDDLTGSTMKTCSGIVDYYKSGFIIPLWSDTIIETGPIGRSYLRVCFADPTADSQQHPSIQRGSFLPDKEYSHIKLASPWHIECNKSMQFTMVKPIWNYNDPTEFILPPGSLNLYYQHASNVNIFIKHKSQNHKIQLTAGTPLAHLIPQSEESIEIKCHFLRRAEFDERSRTPFKYSFTKGYSTYVRAKKEIERD